MFIKVSYNLSCHETMHGVGALPEFWRVERLERAMRQSQHLSSLVRKVACLAVCSLPLSLSLSLSAEASSKIHLGWEWATTPLLYILRQSGVL